MMRRVWIDRNDHKLADANGHAGGSVAIPSMMLHPWAVCLSDALGAIVGQMLVSGWFAGAYVMPCQSRE